MLKISEKQGQRSLPLRYILTKGKARYFILSILFGICTLFYYFGDLAKRFDWVKLQWSLFYVVHDVYRLLFLAPILYAAFYLGTTLTLLVSVASLVVFLPRAIFLSPFPDPIARAVIFAIVEAIIGLLIAKIHNKPQQLVSEVVHVLNAANLPEIATKRIENGEFASREELEFNLSSGLIKRHGHVLKLTRTEYKLLAFMVNNRGKVLGHQEILRNIWGPEYGREYEYLRTFIHQLRRKIEDDPSNPKYIVTEQGVGYRFVETK